MTTVGLLVLGSLTILPASREDVDWPDSAQGRESHNDGAMCGNKLSGIDFLRQHIALHSDSV